MNQLNIDPIKVGRQLSLLRRDKGFTGEALAELLGVSPQAVSKWENGKNLPETALLPGLSRALGCSIDALLLPRELVILSANYTDGETALDVTRRVEGLTESNSLHLAVSRQALGAIPDNHRVRVLLVKYRIPQGTFYAFAPEGATLELASDTLGIPIGSTFKIMGAWYGNRGAFADAMVKINHYDYFNWDEIPVDHETFPSATAADEAEYLTLVYVNLKGIFAVSCAEGERIGYADNRAALIALGPINLSRLLPGVMILNWAEGRDCTWAGALQAALACMGEPYTYEQVMGLSGACYRLAFTAIWDWSAVDARVAFDYVTIAFMALGYQQIWADRVDKADRARERRQIVQDIDRGRPVMAINLRIAPEWGLITGYLEGGKRLLCRTYFDREIIDAPGFQLAAENGSYLEADNWPFLIAHFGKRLEKLSPRDSLLTSLKALVDSFSAPPQRGYTQGEEAYRAWMAGLGMDDLWMNPEAGEGVSRRLSVNDTMLMSLIDARRCAAAYLEESAALLEAEDAARLMRMAGGYLEIAQSLQQFRTRLLDVSNTPIVYNGMETRGVSTPSLRREQIGLLTHALEMESGFADNARRILDGLRD